jgi:hypothetical protein
MKRTLSSEIKRNNKSNVVTSSEGGAAQIDNADELIDLIQATISPKSWDVNGGLSTIQYYARKHALVVRAPAHVHQDVGSVLEAVRNVGQ